MAMWHLVGLSRDCWPAWPDWSVPGHWDSFSKTKTYGWWHLSKDTWGYHLASIDWHMFTYMHKENHIDTHKHTHTQRQFKHYIHICICLKCIIFTSGIYQEVILALFLMVPDSYHLYNALWPLLLIILLSVTVDGSWFATARSHPAVNPPLDASLLCSSLQD